MLALTVAAGLCSAWWLAPIGFIFWLGMVFMVARDPGLRAIAGRWRILKFRHLRRLAGMNGLTRAQFAQEFSGDPIEPPEQMKLF